jgi:predicted RNase H-like nuclease
MDIVRGVDGCIEGWLSISLDLNGGRPFAKVFPQDARGLLSESSAVTTIDIPIGLPTTGARQCDGDARRLLKTRRSSVFPAPVRAVL